MASSRLFSFKGSFRKMRFPGTCASKGMQNRFNTTQIRAFLIDEAGEFAAKDKQGSGKWKGLFRWNDFFGQIGYI
jgi:hypothetical protein